MRASTLGRRRRGADAAPRRSTRATRIVIDGVEYAAHGAAARPHDRRPPIRRRSSCARAASACARWAAIQTALAASPWAPPCSRSSSATAVARTITRPLAPITDHMRQVAATGDLTQEDRHQAAAGGWDDDDAHMLATTFNTLTDSIARFQREAAQRERLSSLGRLSTVIAHEVRNPLMIIKGALRSMTRDGATRRRRPRRRHRHRRRDRAAEQRRQRCARRGASDSFRSGADRHQRRVPRRRPAADAGRINRPMPSSSTSIATRPRYR